MNHWSSRLQICTKIQTAMYIKQSQHHYHSEFNLTMATSPFFGHRNAPWPLIFASCRLNGLSQSLGTKKCHFADSAGVSILQVQKWKSSSRKAISSFVQPMIRLMLPGKSGMGSRRGVSTSGRPSFEILSLPRWGADLERVRLWMLGWIL